MTPGAKRNRRYRERQRQSVRMVSIPVSISAIATMTHLRLLPDGAEHDKAQLADAIVKLIRKAAQP